MRKLLLALTSVLVLFCVVALAGSDEASPETKAKEKSAKKKGVKLPPCAACAALVASFEAGIKRTARGNLAGGDTSWEERNQAKGYAQSEVRLVEIQEKLCDDVERGQDQCHDNHHAWEAHLEEWWQEHQDEKSLKDYLCVETLKVCCPDGHFGPDCTECSQRDSAGKLCSGNGKCKGSGTRKGNGACSCDPGYKGALCDACALGYYQSYADNEKRLCSACHASCEGHCTAAGPKACAACKSGYLMDTERGCQDVDECASSRTPCKKNEFCVNTEGSHKCFACDKACATCFGDGPDSCTECAPDFVMQKHKEGSEEIGEGVCVNKETASRMFNISSTRYFTYFGLCVAACIIFQRSAYISGALGLVIAFYISLSEYYLQDSSGELRPIGPGGGFMN